MAQHTKEDNSLRVESRVITRTLLETALRTKEARNDINVKHFTVKRGSEIGDSFLSVGFLVKVMAEENNVEKTYDLFVKTAHDNEILRYMTLVELNIFRRENMVFTELFKDIMAYRMKLGVGHLDLSVPSYVHSEVECNDPVLILENLQPRGYVMADKKTGLNYEECRLVMREIAIFHAFSYAMKDRDPTKLNKYDFYDYNKSNHAPFHLVKCLHSAIDVVKDLSTDTGFLHHVDRLAALDFDKTIRDLLTPIEPYAVICHGDLWCNNLLFKYKDTKSGKTPEDVKMVDFQVVRYSLPTNDLAYFFYSSTTQRLRREHLKDLLRHYHSVFLDSLERLDIQFPEFTFAKFENLFTKSILFGVLSTFMRLPGFLSNPDDLKFNGKTEEDMRQFVMKLSEKIPKSECAPILADRLIGVVEDAIEMGVL